MAKTRGARPLDGFERDFLRLMIGRHGWSYGKAARHLGRPKPTVYTTYKQMEREGTLGQLALPVTGLEIEALNDER